MGWREIVLLAAIALWLISTVIFLVRRKGKGCSNCSNCDACGSCENRTDSDRE